MLFQYLQLQIQIEPQSQWGHVVVMIFNQWYYRFASSTKSGVSIFNILIVLLFLKCTSWCIRKCAEQSKGYNLLSDILVYASYCPGMLLWVGMFHSDCKLSVTKRRSLMHESSPLKFVAVIQWSIMQGKWLFLLVLFYFFFFWA